MTDSHSDERSKGSVDWEVARKLTAGDTELLDELLALFPKESNKQLGAISDAIEQGDGPGLVRAAHTLKSSANMFGASALAAHALEMETLAQAANIVEAKSLLPHLHDALERVFMALEQGPQG